MLIKGWILLLLIISTLNVTASVNEPDKDDVSSRVNLKGKVVDHSTREVLSGVAITLDGINKTVYSDFDGNFVFDRLVPGKYDITISYPAYKDKKIIKMPIGVQSRDDKLKDVTVFLSSVK